MPSYSPAAVKLAHRWEPDPANTGTRARRAALALNVGLTGTLGLLLDAKRVGLIPALRPHLERLQQLGFRMSARTRTLLLQRSGEIA